jgi:O-antigen ligase
LIPSLAFARQIDRDTSLATYVQCMIWVGIAQVTFLFGMSSELEVSLEFKRLQSETLNAISYGILGSVSILLGGIGLLLFSADDTSHQWFEKPARGVKLLCTASIVLGAATMFLSGSRGPFLSAFLCLSIAFFRALRFAGNRIGMASFAIGFVISGALVLLPLLIEIDIPLFERIFRTIRGEELSDSDRFSLWASGWDQFIQSPLWGSGLEEQVIGFYVHNLPLEAFMATGIFGGLLWLAMLFVGVRRAIQIIWYQPPFAWIAMTFLLLMSNSMFSGNIWKSGATSDFLVALYAVPLSNRAAEESRIMMLRRA